MKFFNRTKGAVSIFLVIILVPVMTISALYVDVSKIALAKSVAAAAGDLTLNTALTDYDTKLKELYGLFATAQDTDDLYEKLEDYYRSCITSAGVSDEDADSYVTQIMAQLGMAAAGDETADILNMELVDFNVSKNTSATLANPTVLKKQIVDFMKYRAPINTGLSFLNSLQSFSTLSKQTDLVDKRTKYYEEEKTVMEILQNAWNEILAYNASAFITDENYFANMKTALDGYEAAYKTQINQKTIMDLYDTQGYVDYDCKVWKEPYCKERNAAGDEIDLPEGVWRFRYAQTATNRLYDYTEYYPKSVGGYDKDNLPTAEEINTLINAFYTNLQKMDSEKADLETNVPAGTYELQYLVQKSRTGALPRYTSAAQNVYSTYQKLKNAMIWVDGYDLDGVEVKDGNGNKITAQSIKDTWVSTADGSQKVSDAFLDIETKYDNAMTAAQRLTDLFSGYAETVRTSGITSTDAVNGLAADISATMQGYVSTLETAAGHLETASEKIKSAELSVKSGGLSQAKSAWKTAAENTEIKNTSMAKQDKAEINQLGSYLNVEEMDKFTARLDQVALHLRQTSAQIKNYQFDNVYIGDITGYDSIYTVIGSKAGSSNLHSVPLDTEQLRTWADSQFQWESGNVSVDWIHQSGTQVKLHGETDKLNFYSYLYTHFNSGAVLAATADNKKAADDGNGKQLYQNIKDTSNAAAVGKAQEKNENIGTDNEISAKTIPVLPSVNKGDNKETPSTEITKKDSSDISVSDTSAGLNTMFGSLAQELINMGTSLRDNLYVSDYIIGMFSYDTIENEYIKKEAEKTGKTESDIKVDIQSMTGEAINAANNYAYGREVEYIIFGGTNASNLTKTYGSIFGIRLGFNLIYAFMDSSIRDSAFAIATPISAATLGIIPVPLIQAAIIIGVACCESAIDLAELKAGERVPLFKTQDTWHCSVKGLMKEAKGIAKETMKYAAEQVADAASEELTKLLDMTDEELTQFISTGTEQLEKYVGDSYDALITRHANTVIQKLTTLTANALEEQKMNTQINVDEYIKNGLNQWLAEEGAVSDKEKDLSYQIKEAAVHLIVNHTDTYLTPFINALKDSAADTAGSMISEILGMPDVIDENGNVVTDIGGNIMGAITSIRGEIIKQIENTGTSINTYKTKMLEKVKESAQNGVDSLKNTLNEQIDGVFGAGGSMGDKDNTGVASFVSFRYSDYLRLFLMIGLYTNESAVLLRTADVIQVNMQQVTGNDQYELSKSSVYVNLSATIMVKPTLLALPLFSDVENNPVEDTNWYTIEYSDIKGY